jgi:hypothetical protein
MATQPDSLSVWCSAGFGQSSYTDQSEGMKASGNLGFGLSYSHFVFKYERRVNGIYFIWDDYASTANSHEMLLGLITPVRKLRAGINIGIGSLEQTTRVRLPSSDGAIPQYEMVSRSAMCVPIEIEISRTYEGFIGLSFTGFSVISHFKPIVGIHATLMLGYL